MMKRYGMMTAACAALGAMTAAERTHGRYMRGPDHPAPKPTGVPLEMKSWLEGVEQKLADAKVDGGLMREIKSRVDELEQKAARRGGGGSGALAEGKSIGTTFAEAEGLADFRSDLGRRPGSFQMETKAITTASNSAGALMAPAYREPAVALAQRRLAVRSLVNAIPIETGSVETPVQTNRVSNAGMVAEGTLKPESQLAWEMRNAPVRKIAHWVLQSSEILADAPQLAGVIDTELIYGLDYVEDVQLLKGDGTGQNLPGMKPMAIDYVAPFVIPNATLIDQVGLALLQVTLADYDPDGVVLHPSDWMKMRLLKDADGKYLLGDPGANVAPVLFGKPVVPTKAQSVGEFTVGEFKVAATIYDRMTTTVLASTEDGDNFRRNMVTILAEKRLAFVTKRPTALVDGPFA